MRSGISYLTIFTTCIALGQALQFPSYLKACSRNDPELNKCALKSGKAAIQHIVKGDRKYLVPNMTPLLVEKIEIDNGASNSQPIGLKILMTNIRVHGLPNTNLDDIALDLKNMNAAIYTSYPELQMLFDYNATGRMLVLPISGHGPGNITLVGMNMTFAFAWDLETMDDGQLHIVLKEPTVKLTFERVYFTLDNLFDGNKLLAENMNKFMNENWEDVIKDVSPAIEEAFSEVNKQLLVGICKVVPYDNIFPV